MVAARSSTFLFASLPNVVLQRRGQANSSSNPTDFKLAAREGFHEIKKGKCIINEIVTTISSKQSSVKFSGGFTFFFHHCVKKQTGTLWLARSSK
ncbi:hypothetical protein SDJN02_23875, partial [Cucurbita argyrosperma subsp. argyrosperma]